MSGVLYEGHNQILSALKCLIWTPPIAQYPSLILLDCVLICGLIMRSYLGPMMYSRPCASSPTRCFNTLITLQAIKGGSNRLTQVLGQYSYFCYRRLNVNLLVGLVHNACPFSAWHTPSELFYLLTQWRRTSHRVFQLML